MQHKLLILLSVTLSLVAIVSFAQRNELENDAIQVGPNPEPPRRGSLNVNVPLFYDMIKTGNSLGINVLQGLVRVDRGQEAERSGLSGPRPLSVRVFGIPIYERGTRTRSIDSPPPASGSRPESGQPNFDEIPL